MTKINSDPYAYNMHEECKEKSITIKEKLWLIEYDVDLCDIHAEYDVKWCDAIEELYIDNEKFTAITENQKTGELITETLTPEKLWEIVTAKFRKIAQDTVDEDADFNEIIPNFPPEF
jgi:hypothetical protein